MCDDLDLYPDELLGDIANRLGFGREFDELLDAVRSPDVRTPRTPT